MLNYPKSGDTIVVNNVTEQSDCRAFRVFEHYISALEEHMGEDEPPFLCEPVEGSVGPRHARHKRQGRAARAQRNR